MRRKKRRNFMTTENTNDGVPEESIVGGVVLKTLLKDQRIQRIVILIRLEVTPFLEVVDSLAVDEMDERWTMQVDWIIVGNGELQVVLVIASR